MKNQNQNFEIERRRILSDAKFIGIVGQNSDWPIKTQKELNALRVVMAHQKEALAKEFDDNMSIQKLSLPDLKAKVGSERFGKLWRAKFGTEVPRRYA